MRWFKPVSVAGAAAAAAAVTVALVAPAGGALASAGTTSRHAAASLPVITVTMNGTAITVAGALESGAVRVVSKVSKEPMGNPTFVRLDPGVTVSQVLQAAAGDPNNIALIASIVFSPQANKGTSSAEVSLKPGNYAAVDLANQSATPPLTTFTITRNSSPAKLPKPAAVLNSIEFAFRGPGTLHDGQLVRFGNKGFLVHMMLAFRAPTKAQAQELARYLREGKNGKAEKLVDGSYQFFGILTHGRSEQQILKLRAGYWVLACFMETQDGRDHTELGMERVIRIVK
jgi:hypothetical protein